MPKLKWDQTGQKFYETGTDQGVVYPQAADGSYPAGYAWNGLTSISESPSGAEANDLYADNIKYLSLISAEDFGYTIEAYYYPPEFEQCDGTAEPLEGVKIGQQDRKAFGFCYRSVLGNDVSGNSYGYKLHLFYNCKASPSEQSYQTINDSPEAISFSWEVKTTPVPVTVGNTVYKPTAKITIDSTKVDETKLNNLLDILYGTDGTGGSEGTVARLPLPAEVISTLS